jgi:hypothetical protein
MSNVKCQMTWIGSLSTGPFSLKLEGYPVLSVSHFMWELQGKDTTVLDCQGFSTPRGFLMLGNGVCDISLNCEVLALDGGDVRLRLDALTSLENIIGVGVVV